MSAPNAKVPSLGRRVAFAALRLTGLLVVFVAIPLGVLNVLASHGITPPVSLLTVSTVGIALAVLGAAGTIARPTRVYGPIALAASVLMFLYLETLAHDNGVVTIPLGSGSAFQLSYGNAILLIALVPALGAVAAILTTAEDLRRPGERLPYDYPP